MDVLAAYKSDEEEHNNDDNTTEENHPNQVSMESLKTKYQLNIIPAVIDHKV